jgi:hypothetical protein
MDEELVFKQQKVESLNDVFDWKNALDQRVIFLDHVEQLIKLFELYPNDYIRLQEELRLARDKTKWSIQECKKQFAFTRIRYESGWEKTLEIEGSD